MGLIHHPDRCTGCRTCQMVCSVTHGGSCGPSGSRITLDFRGLEVVAAFGVDCDRCARCASTCPTGALERGMDLGHLGDGAPVGRR